MKEALRRVMNLQLADVTYRGPELTDITTLALLPESYRALLKQVNGFVAYGGGLHVRGLCAEPDWHSLQATWHGSPALHRLYPALRPTDIPFGQDAVGDQYLLRNDEVHCLLAETGELRAQGLGVETFLQQAYTDPLERLGLHPLRQFQIEGHALLPGQLLSVYPPFCVTPGGGRRQPTRHSRPGMPRVPGRFRRPDRSSARRRANQF